MKTNNRFYCALFTILVLMVWSPTASFAATQIPNTTLKIILNQSVATQIKAQSVGVEHSNPEQYMVELLSDFYQLTIVDTSGSPIFEGKIKKIETVLVEHDPSVPQLPDKTVHPDLITIYLPHFNEAKRVKISDETGKLLLEINLDLYSITTTDRYANCDECGYCKGAKPPENWDRCRACLYPSAHADYLKGETLLLNNATDRPAFKSVGRSYNDFGCIISPAGFMSAEGRASSAQFFLTIIYTVTGAIAMIALIYGAFLIISAKGDPEQISRGKRMIVRAIIGVILVYLMVFLINFIGSKVLRLPGFA